MTKLILYVFVVCAVLVGNAWAHWTGAPREACEDMMPQHQGIEEQESALPYEVTVDANQVNTGDKVTVTISGGNPFRGFLAQVRNEASGNPTGTITIDDAIGHTFTCPGGENNSVTHNSGEKKPSVTFIWTAPEKGSYKIYVTVAENAAVFWVHEPTVSITVDDAGTYVGGQARWQPSTYLLTIYFTIFFIFIFTKY